MTHARSGEDGSGVQAEYGSPRPAPPDPHDYEMPAGLTALARASEGIIVGVGAFLVVDWLSARWAHNAAGFGSAGEAVLTMAVFAALSMAYLLFRPRTSVWVAATMLLLVVAGFMLSGSVRDFADTDLLMGGDIADVLKRGAREPAIGAFTGALFVYALWHELRGRWAAS